MSFKDKISKLIQVSEDNYYSDPEPSNEYEDYEEEDRDEYEPSSGYNPRSQKESKADHKVVSINQGSKLQVILTKPKTMEDARIIADSIKQRKAVVVNLESINGEISRRVLDFLSGVTYATSSTMRPVANGTYMITPHNVDVNGDVNIELGNNGFGLE